MPRTVTTLLSSKVLASLPSTTSLLLSHDLHDPLLHVELLLLSLKPLLLSPRTPPLVPQPATISLICQWLPSIWPPTTRQWCFPGCYSIIAASLVHYSPLTLPLQPRTTLYTLPHLLEREVGQRHCSPSSGDLYLIFNRAKQISTCMAIYILLLYKNAYTPRKYSCTTTIADSGISVTQLSLDLDFQLLP